MKHASTMMILPGLALTEIRYTEQILHTMTLFAISGRRRMDSRQINEHYAEIARELIETESSLEDILSSNVQIIYLSSNHKKKNGEKVVFGQCEKVQEKYKWSIPCDFTITVFEPNCEGFTEDQFKILLFHELLHVGIELKEDGTESYSIKGHDLEDFKEIIERFGTNWAEVD